MRNLTAEEFAAIQTRIKATARKVTFDKEAEAKDRERRELEAARQRNRERLKPKAKPKLLTEHQEQCAVIKWWDAWSTERGIDHRSLFAIPNGGHRHIATGKKLKGEGVRAGVPDLMLAIPTRLFPAMFIEMKRVGEKVAAGSSQAQMIELLRKQGYNVVACVGAEEAIMAIQAYLIAGGGYDQEGEKGVFL